MKRFFHSPYTVMGVVLVMYLIKVTAKLGIGMRVHSPMITGDGWHNVADIFEALMVIGVIFFSRLPASDSYPLGRKNIESLFSVLVGVGLALAACSVIWSSISGAIALSAGAPAGVLISWEFAPWVMGVTLGSALLSMGVSRYQIKIGRDSGHEALVADGEETRSDGRIELATFIGVCGEYFFHSPWIEYPFALIVAYLMFKTAWEIFNRGWGALMKRSIGLGHEQQIRLLVEDLPGVVEVDEIKTFRTGSKVILILKVLTRQDSRINRLLKKAMAVHIAQYLRSEEFEDGDFFIRFDEPDPERFRRAVAVHTYRGNLEITRELDTADAVMICDIEHGRVVRATRHECDLSYDDRMARVHWFRDLLVQKRAVELVVFEERTEFGLIDAHMLKRCGIKLTNAAGRDPVIYGL